VIIDGLIVDPYLYFFEGVDEDSNFTDVTHSVYLDYKFFNKHPKYPNKPLMHPKAKRAMFYFIDREAEIYVTIDKVLEAISLLRKKPTNSNQTLPP